MKNSGKRTISSDSSSSEDSSGEDRNSSPPKNKKKKNDVDESTTSVTVTPPQSVGKYQSHVLFHETATVSLRLLKNFKILVSRKNKSQTITHQMSTEVTPEDDGEERNDVQVRLKMPNNVPLEYEYDEVVLVVQPRRR